MTQEITQAGAVAGPGEAASAVGDAQRLVAVLERGLEGRRGVTTGSRAEWAQLVTATQRAVNTATALQNLAIARLAAIDDDLLGDGTLVESHRMPGHVALDAPDVVAGALGVSHAHAEQRVSLAVRLAVADDDESGAGLGGLHEAMVEGVLDGPRASVVADELAEAPPDVAAAVVQVLAPHLGLEPPAALRGRCRRALARISPDLLVERARRARERCGLRRWVEEPGVDRWEGTFPSERAAEGWAAVDALARRYVAEGRCDTVEAARGEALMDLIRGQATVDVQLVVTVPAEAADGSVPAAGPAPAPLDGTATDGCPADVRSDGVRPDDPAAGAARSTARTALGLSLDRDTAAAVSTRRLAVADEAAGCPDRGDLVEVTGPFPGGPVLVGRGWVTELLRSAGGRPLPPDRGAGQRAGPTVDLRVEQCHPGTGALLGPGLPDGRGHRPGRRIVALVRARDGQCRFPGCSVAARFCDLDHVRPWPGGPTAPANLLCLCRRHHRVKQRPRWWVRLLPDGRVVWTDPTGRVRTSWPRDLLTPVVLRASAGQAGPGMRRAGLPAGSAGRGARAVTAPPGADTVVSALETLLGVRVEHAATSGRPGAGPGRGCSVGRRAARGGGPDLRWNDCRRFHHAEVESPHVRSPSRRRKAEADRRVVGDPDPPPF